MSEEEKKAMEKMRKELERERWENVWLLQRVATLEARLKSVVVAP